MDSNKVAEQAADRYLENVVYLKSFVNKSMSKGDLLKLLHFTVEYPLQQSELKTHDKKLASLAALVKQINKDKTLLTINAMGGVFKEDSNENQGE